MGDFTNHNPNAPTVNPQPHLIEHANWLKLTVNEREGFIGVEAFLSRGLAVGHHFQLGRL